MTPQKSFNQTVAPDIEEQTKTLTEPLTSVKNETITEQTPSEPIADPEPITDVKPAIVTPTQEPLANTTSTEVIEIQPVTNSTKEITKVESKPLEDIKEIPESPDKPLKLNQTEPIPPITDEKDTEKSQPDLEPKTVKPTDLKEPKDV